jgi:hypothetical protein
VHQHADVGVDSPLDISPLALCLGIAGVSRHRWRGDCIAGSLESLAIVGEGNLHRWIAASAAVVGSGSRLQ